MTSTIKSRGRARTAEKLKDQLQLDMATTWPDLDCEVSLSQEGQHFRVYLRIAALTVVRDYDVELDRKTRRAAAFLRRKIEEFVGHKPSVLICPRRRQHSDFRAPRFSHYDGATWVFSTSP